MKNPMKFVRVPVAAHGLHKHPFNFPTLTTCNFFDVVPMWYQPLHKGESVSVNSSLFARTNATTLPSMVTGRINYKAIFVPYRYVWAPYYACDQGEAFVDRDGVATVFDKFIFAYNSDLSKAFATNTIMCTPASSSVIYDIQTFDNGTDNYYVLTDIGHRVLRILDMLGSRPNFDYGDDTEIKMLTVLSFVRAFIDYYFPKNYVGNSFYNQALGLLNSNKSRLILGDLNVLMLILMQFSWAFYDESIYDLAWDSPVAPNTLSADNLVSVNDVTNNATGVRQVVSDDPSSVGSPSGSGNKPSNGTPFVGSNGSNSGANTAYGVITQFVLDSLQSLNNYVKRHQLAGGHLLDRLLASRGQKFDNSIVNKSYYVGEYDYELEISAVENNSDTNLGELAGKGVVSSKDKPLSFDFKDVDDDGIALIIAVVYPDCDLPVNIDPFNLYVNQLDAYHAEFDKLGVEAVPTRTVFQSTFGYVNSRNNGVFGFLPRYYGYVAPRARLSGDFAVPSRGSFSLQAYHTFRELFDGSMTYVLGGHSYYFMRAGDASQYQRLFYSSKQDNIIVFNRWFGQAMMQKLPLGDSVDWDDDEVNRRVNLMNGGNV